MRAELWHRGRFAFACLDESMRRPINRRQRAVWLYAGLSLLIIGFIFYNSLQNGPDSNAASSRVMLLLKPILDPWDRVPEDVFHRSVRKLAHFTEFCALGLSLSALAGRLIWKKPPMTYYAPAILALAVALTDEFIQRFTGRTSSLKDVAIDFAGALTGIVLVTVIRIRRARRKARQDTKDDTEAL